MLKFADMQINDEVAIQISKEKSYASHSHDFLELGYCIRGEATHIMDGVKMRIKKGDYFIVDYDAEHSYSQEGSEPLEIINCLFLPGFIDKALNHCRNFNEVVNNYLIKHNNSIVNISPANFVFFDSDNRVRDLLDRIYAEYTAKESGYFEIIRCNLIEIIVLTMRKNSSSEMQSTNRICEYMTDYASKHFAEKNLLGNISRELNFSVSFLSKKFKEETGIAFSEFLQNIRIEQSCRLLANTDKKMTEIAELSGYSDIKFFNALFKKRLGLTPKEFRKSCG